MNVKTKQLVALKSRNNKVRDRWVLAPPTAEEAVEGGTAYERGQSFDENPYPPGTQQHEDWAWGFDETQYRTEYASGEEAA